MFFLFNKYDTYMFESHQNSFQNLIQDYIKKKKNSQRTCMCI